MSIKPNFGADTVNTLYVEFERIINDHRVLNGGFVTLREIEFLVDTTIALPDIRDNIYIPDDLIQNTLLYKIVNEENLSRTLSIGPDSEKHARILFYLRVLSPEKFEEYISKMDEYYWEAMETLITTLRKNAEKSTGSQAGINWKRFARAAFRLLVISADRIEITSEGLKVFYDEKQSDNGNKNIPPLPLVRKF